MDAHFTGNSHRLNKTLNLANHIAELKTLHFISKHNPYYTLDLNP